MAVAAVEAVWFGAVPCAGSFDSGAAAPRRTTPTAQPGLRAVVRRPWSWLHQPWSIQLRAAHTTDIGRLSASAVHGQRQHRHVIGQAIWRSVTPAFQRSHKVTSCASSSTGCRPLRLGSPMSRRSATS